MQTELDPLERELREYTIASIAQLDETTREATLEAGRNMSLEEAIDYALQTLADRTSAQHWHRPAFGNVT